MPPTMKRCVAAFIFCIATLISCKKDNDTPALREGMYSNKSLATSEPIVLYIGDKMITDPVFIHNFLQRRLGATLPESGFTEETSPNSPFDYTSVTISGDSVAYYALDPDNSYVDTFHINSLSANTRLLVEKKESIIKPTLIGEFGCTNVAKHIRRNPPSYTCIDLSQPTSYCIGRKQFQLNIENDHLVIPVLTYYFIRPVSYYASCITSERHVRDDFNRDILGKLHPEDTLVVQTYFLKLYKQ